MNTILSALQQSFREIWQDKRTLWSRMFLPFLTFWLLLLMMIGSFGGCESQNHRQANQDNQSPADFSSQVKIGVAANDNGKDLVAELKANSAWKVEEGIAAEDVERLVEKNEFEVGLVIDESFDDALRKGYTGDIIVYVHPFSQTGAQGIQSAIELYEKQVLAQRLKKLNLPEDLTDPINATMITAMPERNPNPTTEKIEPEEASSDYGQLGELSLLVFTVILYYCWLGGIYPALALFSSDATQQLIVAPNDATNVLLGRILAVMLCGVGFSLLLWLSLDLLLNRVSSDSNPYIYLAQLGFNVPNTELVLLGLVPLSAVFSSFMAWSVLKNRTFKEAQNRLQPLKITVFVLLFFGLTAGFGINILTLLIPGLNIGNISHELMHNEVNFFSILIGYVACFGVAYLCFQSALKIFKTSVSPPPSQQPALTVV